MLWVIIAQPKKSDFILNNSFDVIVIGAGAAGLMCAIESAKRNKKVLVLDHAKKIGEKIRISGGGRCNFTNLNTHPSKFISENPKFMISALNQYDQYDFINQLSPIKLSFMKKNQVNYFVMKALNKLLICFYLNVKSIKLELVKNLLLRTSVILMNYIT